MTTFFRDEDYQAYISLLGEWCKKCGVEIWAYCLMPNHVHLITVPESEDGLRRGIGEAHRRYSRMINFRENWRGHLWQGRFASFPMDESYFLAAARYVELNPVRAHLAPDATSWPWSSARAHMAGADDDLVKVAPLLEIAGDWRLFLAGGETEEQTNDIRKHERTGRPLGSEGFVEKLESALERILKRGKPGPKGKRN
jgi:putative transposase